MLVIGGGGYTFPRYAKTELPETVMDVVEIDPGVTKVAYDHLGLKPGLTNDFNMDGRQFVAERATPRGVMTWSSWTRSTTCPSRPTC